MKTKLSIAILFLFSFNLFSQPAYIKKGNQEIYVNGMNLAWISFASDLSSSDMTTFTKQIKDIKNAGGNTVRWWIHVNGTTNPAFSNTTNKVTGINSTHLKNLKKACDTAYANGVLLDLCLWSFDMLQSGLSDNVIQRNKLLMTDTTYTNAYIRNALVPMVKALKGHPGILCWEVFNEPEGMSQFGWTPNKVTMVDIQRVVNLVAGAVHREDPDALVSNGSQLIAYSSDASGYTNYYRPDRLKEIGGDSLGTLDFYMVHYYTSNGTQNSLFRKPASFWGLDKPLVIGEFSARGLDENDSPAQTPEELYNFAYSNGFAGALSWTYTNHDGNGGLPNCAVGLTSIATQDPYHVEIINSANFNFTPVLKMKIPYDFAQKNKQDTVIIGNLKDWFEDKEYNDGLIFKVASTSALANVFINNENKLCVSPNLNKTGRIAYTITATDTGGKKVSANFVMTIIDREKENKAKFQKVSASSNENYASYPEKITDGIDTTHWTSEYSDSQWVVIELDTIYNIQKLLIKWASFYAKEYNLEISTDNANWENVFTEPSGDGKYDLIRIPAKKAKYLKFNLIKRYGIYGFSIDEISAFSEAGVNTPPYVAAPMADKTMKSEIAYTLDLSKLGADKDLGDILSFEVSVKGLSQNPSWIAYNNEKKTIVCSPTYNDTGIYNVVVKILDLSNDFTTDTFAINVVRNPASVNNTKINDVFSFYPNPASTKIEIYQAVDLKSDYSISIIDLNGKVVLKSQMSGACNTLDISNLSAGIYLIKAENAKIQNAKLLEIIR
jgi:hypothetical protein